MAHAQTLGGTLDRRSREAHIIPLALPKADFNKANNSRRLQLEC